MNSLCTFEVGNRCSKGAALLVLWCLIGTLAMARRSLAQAASEEAPNVILIIADDLGYADLGAFGDETKSRTPHINQLAAQGTRFTNAYVTAAICSPSRDAIITGRYQQRWGTYGGYATASLPADEETLAEVLGQEGYTTSMIGKAHYGGAADPDNPEFPLNHGFDAYYGRAGGTMDYVRHTQAEAGMYAPRISSQMGVGPFWEDGEQTDQHGFSTSLFTQRALGKIEQGDEKEQPFFMTLSYNAVHLFVHQFTDVQLARQNFEKVPELAPGTEKWPEYLQWYVHTVKPHTPQGRERYLLQLHKLDQSIGRILDKLEETGQRENTIIAFVSDNGGSPFNYANNAPFRGYKYALEEGGIRVPFFITWPGHIPRGQVSDKLVSSLDIVPTMAAAAGVNDVSSDGVNLLPYLNGEDVGAPHDALYWTGFKPLKAEPSDFPEGSPLAFIRAHQGDRHGWAVRRGDYKLRFLGETREYRLYNLAEDPGEQRDLSGERPQKVKQLKAMWRKWYEDMPISSDN